jgi:predicted ATPase/DNA-binding SARP family transcriptional activator
LEEPVDDRATTQLSVLGSLGIVRDGESVRLGSGQQRRLLAVLVVHANEVVSSDRLIDVLWGDDAPASATHSLQTLLSRLRATLGADHVETCPPGYRLGVASDDVDALRFEELVGVGLGSADQPEVALGVFDQALGLWQGPPYGEFASEEFAAGEVARLVELRARAIEERSATLLELGRPDEVIGDLETEITAEPFRERRRALLMLALARAGRPVEALRAYDAFRRFLDDEIGVVPSPELQALNDDIVRQHPDVRWARSPTIAIDRVGNLPRQVTSFVGREAEIASLSELVCRSSLVTLTGVGGVGKTRLALEIAAEVVGEFPDGVWFCELASVTDPGAVWETVAASLRVQPVPGQTLEESALEYLAAKRLLLVLDNCEHLLDAVARHVDTIEHRCPHVSVLATSREGLAIAGERLIAVPTLGVPAHDARVDDIRQAEAVRLFEDRASAVKRDFALTDRNLGDVAVLCRRLDGIPLAIELAAARVRSLSPEDLVARLDQRFKLLTHGSRAALERHQTLRATIDWSYDLLSAPERHALQRLSVFAGGCDLGAAEAVLPGDDRDVADVIDVVGQLVDKSLVVVDDVDGVLRYRLLETIRQYAREQLDASGDPGPPRRAHAEHYVAMAEAAGPHLRSREQLEWIRAMERDVDNFRVALAWAVETPSPKHALRLVAPLALEGRIGEHAMEWAATAIAIPGSDGHPLFPVVVVHAALGAAFLGGDFERAEHLLTVAEQAQTARGTWHLSTSKVRGILALFRGELEEARRHATDWVELARASGDPDELAHALQLLAAVLQLIEPTPDAAIATLDESVRVARSAGIDTALASALADLAGALPIEESEHALALLDESLEISTRIGERMFVAAATGYKAKVAAQRDDWRTALQASVAAAEGNLELGRTHAHVSEPFTLAGAALCALGAYEPAAVLLGSADVEEYWAVSDWKREIRAATDAALFHALGERQVATLAARGAALETRDAVAYLRAEADRALTTP